MILFLISMHKPNSFPPPVIDSVYSTPLFEKKKINCSIQSPKGKFFNVKL